MNIFAFLEPKMLDQTLLKSILGGNADALRAFSMSMEKAYLDFKSWAANIAMGNVVLGFGTKLCIEIPIDKVNELNIYTKKYEETTNLDFCIGVGMTPIEAYKARLFSLDSEEQLVMYSDEIEDALSEESMDKAESEAQNYSLTLPGLNLEDDDKKQELKSKDQVKSPIKETKSPKQKVIETLMQVKQLAPEIAKLKDSSPQAFQAIKSVVDSLILLASGGLDKEQPRK